MRSAFALFSVLFLAVIPAYAQIEATVYTGLQRPRGGDLGTFGFTQQPITMSSGLKTGARLSLNSGVLTGHELSYGYQRFNLKIGDQQESQASAQDIFYDFVVHFTANAVAVRPFVVAGAGYTSFSPGNGGVFADASGSNELGVNFGGGLKIKMGKFFGLRFDARNHLSRKPNFLDLPNIDGRLYRMEYSAGASLLF